MKQQERSDRSRQQVLDAALRLFSHQGYRGTSMRDIAAAAGVSTGNVYYQFPDKEALFEVLLDQFWQAVDGPDFPLTRALAAGSFPDDLERLGRAARESVRQHRSHVALIYVDVVEFDGKHIRKFFSDMARRFAAVLKDHPDADALRRRMRLGVSPVSAMMLASRFFLHYFAVELVFGVPNHLGKDSDTIVHEIADMLRHGMFVPARRSEPAAGRVRRGRGWARRPAGTP